MTQPKIEDVGHGKPVMPFGSDGTDWYAFLIDALGHLQVDVVSAALGTGGATETTLLLIKGYVDTLETLLSGGLPAALDTGALKTKEQTPLTGFATSANQTTMITALQLIDDLRNALGSVNTDDLQVDVKTSALPTDAATETTLGAIKTALQIIDDFALPTNKIIAYNDRVNFQAYATSTGPGWTWQDGDTVPAGELWIIGPISGAHNDPANPRTEIDAFSSITEVPLAGNPALPIYIPLIFPSTIVLKTDDRIKVGSYDLAVGTHITLYYWGYKMKLA